MNIKKSHGVPTLVKSLHSGYTKRNSLESGPLSFSVLTSDPMLKPTFSNATIDPCCWLKFNKFYFFMLDEQLKPRIHIKHSIMIYFKHSA